MPDAPSSGTPRECQEKLRYGTLWELSKDAVVTGPAVSVFRGKFVLSKNLGYKTRGRHVTKHSSDPRVAYPEVKV